MKNNAPNYKKGNSSEIIRFLPITNFSSRADWEKYAWRKVIKHMSEIPTAERLWQMLQLLISSTEQKNIAYRAAASSLLSLGASYRFIQSELKLSAHTIRAIKQSLIENRYQGAFLRAKLKKPKPVPNTKGTIWDERRDVARSYRNTKYGKLRW